MEPEAPHQPANRPLPYRPTQQPPVVGASSTSSPASTVAPSPSAPGTLSDSVYQTPGAADAVATLKLYFQAIANGSQADATPLICLQYLPDWTTAQD